MLRQPIWKIIIIMAGCLCLGFWGRTAPVAGNDHAGPVALEILASQPLAPARRLHQLLEGVGYDFAPTLGLVGPLRQIGIKRLRLINVDHGENLVAGGRLQAPRLDSQLEWCRVIGASPHIIIGQGIPSWLSTHSHDPNYGPKDWTVYADYLSLLFQHVILDQQFPSATWEVANEPDVEGAPVPEYPRKGAKGCKEDYQAYLQLYRHIAQAAVKFEVVHPGVKIRLGGPAGTPYSFNFGSFNWLERFLKDTAKAGIKLDFLSFHYYGNISAIGKRGNTTVYPPFDLMMDSLREWIARYRPGMPLWITEWGPSYHTNMTPAGLINGNHAGAAWSAAFIDAMLQHQVDRAIFLVTTDLQDNWGWPALFHGTTHKPICHIFGMLQRLRGQLLEVQGGSPAVGALAALDGDRLTAVLWNYNWERGEFGGGQEGAKQEYVSLKFTNLAEKKGYRVTSTLVSESHGNPYPLTLPENKGNPEPLKNELGKFASLDGSLALGITMPPSSVALLEILPDLTP